MTGKLSLPSSFRDPAGFLFRQDNVLYRQVNPGYAADYDALMSSGLYEALEKARVLIPHQEVGVGNGADGGAYKLLRPEEVDYISYPYEWCFSQLRDAALTTLTIQRLALKHGMTLKDASAYNIQFHKGRATLIDSLSFVRYQEGEPWVAYRQFCQHFIAPLALMCCTDVRLSQLLRIHIDGIPLDLAGRLLPMKSYLRPALLTHIHLHARAQARYADTSGRTAPAGKSQGKGISRRALDAMLQSLHSAVKKMSWKLPATEWADYYSATNYESGAMRHKERLLRQFLEQQGDQSRPVHDLGANNGHFSRIALSLGFKVVSQDIDPVAVEHNYLTSKRNRETSLLPLQLDLTNPGGAIGWALEERMSFNERAKAKESIVLALALIHHLAISNNVPLALIAGYLNSIAGTLIIEFVPKDDSQVQRLLSNRRDIFEHYTQACFEEEFSRYFELLDKQAIEDSKRTLYLMGRRNAT